MFKRIVRAALSAAVVLAVIVATVGCGQNEGAVGTTGVAQLGVDATAPVETTTTATAPGVSGAESTTTTSAPELVVGPTLPEDIPGYTDVDPATGLHVTGTPVEVDPIEYRLKISGKVEREISLTYDEVRDLPKTTATPILVCPGYFEDVATWSGVPLHAVLEMAGVLPEAQRLIMRSADGYATTVNLEDALLPENFLAYELAGAPLPALHGFPLRAVFPSKYGSYWVKWLVELEVD